LAVVPLAEVIPTARKWAETICEAGPLELADFIGLDTVFAMTSAVYEGFKDQRYAPPLLLKKMVTAGLLGRKSGKGFYEYQ